LIYVTLTEFFIGYSMNNWNKRFISLLFSILMCFGFSFPAFAVENTSIPYLSDSVYFVDTTGTVPQDVINEANKKAKIYDEKGIQIVGWFINDSPLALRQLSTDFGNVNKIGDNNHQKGVVITVAIDRAGVDGRKPSLFIGTGKGLKYKLTNTKTDQIKTEVFDISKAESQISWYQGFLNTIDRIGGELTEKIESKPISSTESNLIYGSLLLIISILFLMFIGYFTDEQTSLFSQDNQEKVMTEESKKKKKKSTGGSTYRSTSTSPTPTTTDYGYYDTSSSSFTSSSDSSSYGSSDSGGSSFDGGGGGDF
jgi:uncharacterized membrane protein YgcG